MKKLIFLFFVFIPVCLSAYPRFSAYTGDKCVDCHVNPQGSGMRTQYGNNFAKQSLQMDFLKKYSKKIPEFNPQLNKNISIGGDVRVFHVGNENPGNASTNTFLTMQGDLYAYAKVNDYISAYVAPGFQIPNINTKYEVYGMVSNLPLNIYMRAGRMLPTFGTKIVEHRAFQRADLLGTPYGANDGIEVGLAPGEFNFSAGLFNGLKVDFFDTDPKRMFVSSADYMFSFSDNFHLNLGASYYNNPSTFIDPLTGDRRDANRQAFGGFTKIGIMKHIALLGEVDFLENKRFDAITRGLYGFGELNIMLINGLELRGQYEYRTPNRDLGGNRTIRTSIGTALYPLQGLETEAMLRFVNDDQLENTKEFQFSFHFYF